MNDTIYGKTTDTITVANNLHVDGTISYGTLTSPFWAAGQVDGTDVSVSARKGRSVFTITRPAGRPTGIWKVAFTDPHPDGADYVVLLTVQLFNCTAKVWEFSNFAPTADGFHVVILNTSDAVADAVWHFSVLA